jgi:hypothetical protein
MLSRSARECFFGSHGKINLDKAVPPQSRAAEKNRGGTTMVRTRLLPFLFLVSLVGTIASFVFDSEEFMFPMLMTTEVVLSLWLFMPAREAASGEKSAFWAIIAFGSVSVLVSYAFTILVPVFGPAWGVESHPEDANGILYPMVNDGRENCLLGSILFLFYFGIAGTRRLIRKAMPA